MSPAVADLLWDWSARMVILCMVIASYVALYFIGRARGRQAQRRATVQTAFDDAIAETVAIAIPQQRGESS